MNLRSAGILVLECFLLFEHWRWLTAQTPGKRHDFAPDFMS
jgi:hypothetical protein